MVKKNPFVPAFHVASDSQFPMYSLCFLLNLINFYVNYLDFFIFVLLLLLKQSHYAAQADLRDLPTVHSKCKM